MSDPEFIYLQPLCCMVPSEGRLWCVDDVWSDEHDDGTKSVRYARADLLQGALDAGKRFADIAEAQMAEKHKEREESRLWFERAQRWKEDVRKAHEALAELEQAEQAYRTCHDLHGSGDRRTGRAWDLMRRAGEKARALLKAVEEPETEA